MEAQIKAARQARRGLERVRRELLDPTPPSLQRCSAPLQVAIACMSELSEGLSSEPCDGPPLRAELAVLRRELTNVNALLESAATFYDGYARLLGAEPPEPGTQRKFVVHG